MPRKSQDRKSNPPDIAVISPQLASQLGSLVERIVNEQCRTAESDLRIQMEILQEDADMLQCLFDELASQAAFHAPPGDGVSETEEE